MGCGVSKEEIVQPSRIQTVVVNVGSPESHLKAHEAAQQQQNHGLISLATEIECTPRDVVEDVTPSRSLLETSAALSDDEHNTFEHGSPEARDDVQGEEASEDLPGPPCFDGSCSSSPKAQEMVQGSPLLCTNNGVIGTLASLDEIFGSQEALSRKLAIKMTTEKIMSYGGVLHSLEDQVGSFSPPPDCKAETPPEVEHQTRIEYDSLGSSEATCGGTGSPTLTRSPKFIEVSRKKLPPILSPPNSFIIDKSLMADPFAKAPFPMIYCSSKLIEKELPTQESSPPSSHSSHTVGVVLVENVKDILVMDGDSSFLKKNLSPPDCMPVDNLHSDATIENIILLDSSQGDKPTKEGPGSRMHQRYHDICVTNISSELDELNGINLSSPLPLFSAHSHRARIEELEEDDNKPLSSSEFYS